MCVINEEFKCKNCGEKARFVQGVSRFESRYEQHYCDNCGNVFVTKDGAYFRDGILEDEPIYYENDWGIL